VDVNDAYCHIVNGVIVAAVADTEQDIQYNSCIDTAEEYTMKTAMIRATVVDVAAPVAATALPLTAACPALAAPKQHAELKFPQRLLHSIPLNFL